MTFDVVPDTDYSTLICWLNCKQFYMYLFTIICFHFALNYFMLMVLLLGGNK